MATITHSKSSRRDFLKLTAATAAFGPFFLFPDRALSSRKTLKIAKWAHFLPEFDQWFVNSLAEDWGKQNDTTISVDIIAPEQIRERAFAEVNAAKGHDIFMFPWPPAEFHHQVIDHGEIYQTVAGKYGQINRLAYRSTFNPKTQKYFAVADSWIPTPFLYFEDYWAGVGMPLGPVHYGDLRIGGQGIRAKVGIPAGLALAPSLEGNITLHTLLYAFGGMIVDPGGNVAIKNAPTYVALQYVKSLYQDAGTPEQLIWGSSGNVKAMLARKTSCTMNGISLLRAAEKQHPEVAEKIMITPPLKGSSGGGIVAFPHVTSCSAVWNFADNRDGAKRFLADLIDNSRTIYEKSQGCNFPFYQKTVPDLIVRLQKDAKANPPYKYTQLKDALYWTRNLGVPGYATPEYMEVFNTSVIPRMFVSVVKGESNADDARNAAAAEIQRIVDKWKKFS